MNTETKHPEELLAWYVNGRLSDSERAEVEAHIAGCDYCQGEISLLKIMRAEAKKTAASPGELAKLRFMREIKRDKAATSTPATGTWWKQGLAVAAALVIMIQTGVILTFGPKTDSQGPGIQTAQTAPKADPAAGVRLASGMAADLKLQFQPDATVQQVNRLLDSINARIVSGPDADQYYEVDVEGIDRNTPADKLRALVSRLQKEKTIVKYAQGNTE